MDVITRILQSNIVKYQVGELVENAIGVMMKDPIAAKNAVSQLLYLPSTIRDGIYWENFQCYILHVYDIDSEGRVNAKLKRKLAEMLAEDIPNEEAGYEGNTNRLRENAKRLVKLIDDVGTIQKSIYLANLTRSVLNEEISRRQFFKLCKCVRDLTEEDLAFFISDIQCTWTSTIKDERDTIDDFRSVGLLMEADGGFLYTRRAFELLKYGLLYEHDIKIPEEFKKRMTVGGVTQEEMSKLLSIIDVNTVMGADLAPSRTKK